MDYPKISCVCVTYDRIFFLEEALECFLRQDYKGEKELIILNDCETQQIEFDHPEVKVYNHPRYETLGHKRNESCELASGKYICSWDDDDIHMPWRLTTLFEGMENDHFMNMDYMVWESKNHSLNYRNQNFFGSCMFSKELFQKIKFPLKHKQEDKIFFKDISEAGYFDTKPLRNCYIYRFGNWAHATYKGKFECKDKEKKVYKLTPQWHRDYFEVNDRIESLIKAQKSPPLKRG